MCGGCSPATCCSYVGGILINGSFIALISWGTAVFWPIGLGLSAIYAVLLFTGAACLARRKKAPRIAVDLLYLLGVIGVGVTGVILAYNTVGCDALRPPNGSGEDWVTRLDSSTPTEVRDWVAEPRWTTGATFVQTSGGSLFFAGSNETHYTRLLWRSAGGATPHAVSDDLSHPTGLVSDASRVCFSPTRKTAHARSSAMTTRLSPSPPRRTVPRRSAIHHRRSSRAADFGSRRMHRTATRHTRACCT